MTLFGGFPGAYRHSLAGELSAAQAKGEAASATRTARELAVRLDRAVMACEAMWSLMRDKLDLADEDLLRRINDLDLSDGRLDGRVRKTPVACPKCSRTISPRLPKCMYCGQAVMFDPFA